MVYKRYIKIGEKLYGPYIYESRREGDKVISVYKGTVESEKAKRKIYFVPAIIIFSIVFALAVLLFVFINLPHPTGKITLQVSPSYQQDEAISGMLKLSLKQGSLIPSSSVISISLAGEERQFLLSDLIADTQAQGSFYVENAQISGSGQGYGIAGIKTTYPDIEFKLKISKEKEEKTEKEGKEQIKEPNQTLTTPEIPIEQAKTPQETSIEEPLGTTPEPPAEENQQEETPSEESDLEITGAIVEEKEEKLIDAVVSAGNPFNYALEEGETAGIVQGSVRLAGAKDKKIDESALNLQIQANQLTITTSYSETETGFGADFTGDEVKTIEIPLEKLNITAQEGTLRVALQYNDAEIISASADVNMGYKAPEMPQEELEEIPVEQPAENISEIPVIPEENITNATAPEINITIPENITEINITEINQTNITYINVTGINITTIQYQAVIGKPVKWKKILETGQSENITIKLPASSTNITLKEIKEGEITETILTGQAISGKVGIELELGREPKFITFFKKLFRLTGKVTEGETSQSEQEVEVNISTAENADYELEYYTKAPYANETETSAGSKEIVISSDIHYENILSYTFLPVEVSSERAIKLKWKIYSWQNLTALNLTGQEIEQLNNQSMLVKEISFDAYDTNNNTLIDYIEWIVPALSNQTYEISITILNVHSYPSQYGNWTVAFNTTGIADLTITATQDLNYTNLTTRWHNESENEILYDLKFLEVGCGNETKQYEWLGENCSESECSVFIENYSCNETAQEISKVLTAKPHVLRFEFGGQIVYAYNYVTGECSGTEPPSSGNWTIANTTNCTNTNIVLNGNLTILPGANLTFNNVTLQMNSSYNGEFVINNSGRFIINNSNLTAVLTNGSGQYEFWNLPNSKLEIYGTNITYLGHNSIARTSNMQRGLFVNTNNTIIKNNRIVTSDAIADSNYNIYLYQASNNTIFNNFINSSRNSGANTYSHGILISTLSDNNNFTLNSIFTNSRYSRGIYLEDSSDNYFEGNNISVNSNGFSSGFYSDNGTNSTFINNTIVSYFASADTEGAIYLLNSISNVFKGNNISIVIATSGRGLLVSGTTKQHYNHSIDTSNIIDNKQVYYFFNNDSQIIEDKANIAVLYYTWSNNITIRNNNFTLESIKLINVENSSVYGNNISVNRNKVKGIDLSNSSYNNISNNVVKGTWDGVEQGILLSSDSSNNILRYNTIETGGYPCQYCDGIYIDNSHYNNISETTIYTAYYDSEGVVLLNSNNNLFTNVSIVTNYTGGINAYGVHFSSSSNNTFINSTINAIGAADIFVTGTDSNTLINTTFDKSNVSFAAGATGSIEVQWYLDAYVNDSAGRNVSNANVSGYNNTDNFVFSALTGSNGYIATQTLTEYMQNATSRYFQTNYTINATKSGYSTSSQVINLTNSSTIAFTLSDIVFPSINFTSPTPANNTATTNTSVQINISITNASDLNEFKWNWNGTNYTFYNDSLVLMFNFDNVSALGESSSSNLTYDASKYGNNGTCSGMGSGCNWTTGKYGKALGFDGVDDYVNITHSASLNPTDAITISAWINSRDVQSRNNIIVDKTSTWTTNGGPFRLMGVNGGQAHFYIYGSSLISATTGNNNLTNNNWHFIVGTYDKTNIKVYVDGVEKASSSASIAMPTNTQPVRIGRQPEAVTDIFNGSIDEVRIWNRSLSAAEIQQQYYSNLYKYDADKWAFYSNQTISEPTTNYTYNYSGCAKDISGNENCTETRALTIQGVAPIVTINLPLAQNYSTSNVSFNATLNDDGSCMYSLNSGLSNYSMQNNGNRDFNATNLSIADGQYTARFYCNDTAGNWNRTETRAFGIDATKPAINLTYPQNTSYAVNVSWLNYTVSDTNLQACRWSSNNGVNNVTIACGTNITGTNSSEGNNTWLVSANDSAGNINFSRVTFVKDTINPDVSTVHNPVNNGNYSNTTIMLNVSVSDATIGLSAVYFNLSNSTGWSAFIQAFQSGGQWNTTLNTSLYYNGRYNLSVFANDSLNNLNSSESIVINIDKTTPLISYGTLTEADGANVTRTWIYVNVSVTEVNFANITFLLRNDTATVNSTTFTTAVYTINWTNLSYTNYTYNVSVYDTGGNFNSTETRKINLQGNYLIINMTYPANGSSLPRGSDTITYEDDAQTVANNISIMAAVYDNRTLAGIQNINCSFYFDSTLIGNALTNSSGGCNLSYDKSSKSFGWHNIIVNYTGLLSGYLKAVNESANQLKIENWTMHVDIVNYRAGVQYFSDDLAGVNITIRRDNSLSNITNLTLVMTDNTNAEYKRFNIENFTQQGTGIYFVETIVPSMNWLRWKAFANFNFSGAVGLINVTSSQHTDVIISLGNATLNITAVNNTDVVFENTTIKLYKYGLLDKYKIYEDYANSTQPWISRAVALYDNDYDVIVDIPDNHTLKLTRLNISSVELKIKVQSANITAPSGIANISRVLASNASVFGKSTLYFVKEFEPTSICRCDAWNFTSAACSGAWQCNSTADYEGFASNITNFWFNVTSFSGYAGGADTSAPTIILISPADSTSTTTTAQTFSYNVSDASNIANCSLIINNGIDQTDTTITKDTTQTFSKTLSVASHTWSVNCTDILNNKGNSATRSLTITSPPAPPGGGGGTGGVEGVPCSESWQCSEWSSCTNEQQARTCTDANSCGTTSNKPTETQPCEIKEPVIEYYSPELQLSVKNNSDVAFTIRAKDISGISEITLNAKWLVDDMLIKEETSGISIESSLLYNFNKNTAVKAVVSNGQKTKELAWNVNVLDVVCKEDWQCSWLECNEQNYSIAVDCIDLNSCGTNAKKPVSVPCYLDPVTGKMKASVSDMGISCMPQWNCGEWSECDVIYKMEDALQGITATKGKQERICTDAESCQPSRLEYQPCVFNIPISMKAVELCNENYVEIYDLQQNMLVSRIKESTIKDTTRLDVRIIATNITGYCDYCYDKIRNYDEEQTDCGGSCPACIEMPLGASYWDIIIEWIKWLLWLLLLVLLIGILIGKIKKRIKKRRVIKTSKILLSSWIFKHAQKLKHALKFGVFSTSRKKKRSRSLALEWAKKRFFR